VKGREEGEGKQPVQHWIVRGNIVTILLELNVTYLDRLVSDFKSNGFMFYQYFMN